MMHAAAARRRGYQVVQLEREAGSRGATVRNFGLVWVSGGAPGAELALALRARELWEELAAVVPGTGFRPHGSLTLAADDAEAALLREAACLTPASVATICLAARAGGGRDRAGRRTRPQRHLAPRRSCHPLPGRGAQRDRRPAPVGLREAARAPGQAADAPDRAVRPPADHLGRRRRLAALLPGLRLAGPGQARAAASGRRGRRRGGGGPASTPRGPVPPLTSRLRSRH